MYSKFEQQFTETYQLFEDFFIKLTQKGLASSETHQLRPEPQTIPQINWEIDQFLNQHAKHPQLFYLKELISSIQLKKTKVEDLYYQFRAYLEQNSLYSSLSGGILHDPIKIKGILAEREFVALSIEANGQNP